MVKKVEYSRGINSSQLILTTDAACEKDSIEMFHHNVIPYFLNMKMQKKDQELQFYYNITSKQSLEQVLEYKLLDYTFTKKVLSSFDQACSQAENYMLTEDNIVLLPELLFLEMDTDEVLYCYLPGYQVDILKQFQGFMEYLLQHLDHKDKKVIGLVYGVYQHVAEGKASLHEVMKKSEKYQKEFFDFSQWSETENKLSYSDQAAPALKKPEESVLEKTKKVHPVNQAVSKEKQEKQKRDLLRFIQNFFRKKIYTDYAQSMEQEYIGEELEQESVLQNPTVCLMPQLEDKKNFFVYQGTDRSRDFSCTEGKKILGSSLQYSDIYIPLPMVSRVHARIEVYEDGTYLEDLNSTNGTQVNGETLKYREKRILQNGDVISIAGESYAYVTGQPIAEK